MPRTPAWTQEQERQLAELYLRRKSDPTISSAVIARICGDRTARRIETKASELRQEYAARGLTWPEDALGTPPAQAPAAQTTLALPGLPAPPATPAQAPAAPPAQLQRSAAPDTAPEAQDYTIIGDRFVFSVDTRIIEIPRDRMDRICADYSEYGGGMKLAELARAHGIQLPILRRILKAYGHYKSSAPFTRETIADAYARGEAEALIQDAVENAEAALLRGFEERRHSRALSRLKELESEEYHRQQVYKAAIEGASRIQVRQHVAKALDRNGIVWHCHAPSTDEHNGKGASKRTGYGEYSTPEAARRLRAHARYVASWALAQPGYLQNLYRSLLGDLWEALKGTTEGGTHLSTDASDPDVWTTVLETLLESIDTLRGVAEHLHLYYVPGNHDATLMHMLAETLRIAYQRAGATDLTIHTHRRPFQHFRVGTQEHAVHMLDHGKGYAALTTPKAKGAADLNAREIAGPDFHGATRIYTYMGHLHESQVAMLGHHHELIRLPAFCENSDYETELRLPGRGGARIFKLSATNGRITDEHRIDFSDMPDEFFRDA